jgi:putative Mg2+ transporter-C (MgtC) family protein
MVISELTLTDLFERLGVALLCGASVGLNRELHHKAAGFKTFSLVAIGTAGITLGVLSLAAGSSDPGDMSRVVQGVLTGIGFLGAGVIMRGPDSAHVTGLTTAASLWLVAGLGMLSGLGNFRLVWVLLVLALALLSGGQYVESLASRWFTRWQDHKETSGPEQRDP